MPNFPKDLLSIADLKPDQVDELIESAMQLKANRAQHPKYLAGKTYGLLFSKPSLRTRLSFETGIFELGGQSLFIREEEFGLGSRESIEDIAKVVSRYLAGLIVRSHNHLTLQRMAGFGECNFINALTDIEHPCQALADLLTLRECFGDTKGLKLTYIGDGNNVAVSLMLLSAISGIAFSAITPPRHEPKSAFVNQAAMLAKQYGSPSPLITNDPVYAADADLLYGDVWVSMGEQSQGDERADFSPYQIDHALMQGRKIPVMHCLPAHQGEEISVEVFSENAALIYNQAENRLHIQKAILVKLTNPLESTK
ncbi:MAG: ornithine carbamoyltransferase [Candidatus Caenarcaniphilales bacterium]|nr:ornithine carbamoyltransferase [Candidatus Caenarcaniphilales bacterium]